MMISNPAARNKRFVGDLNRGVADRVSKKEGEVGRVVVVEAG